MKTCPYVCNNKTTHGYFMTTVCVNPLYNRITINQWMEKEDYVQMVRCKDCEFYTEEERWCRRLGLCGAFDPNGYCSHAERKEE